MIQKQPKLKPRYPRPRPSLWRKLATKLTTKRPKPGEVSWRPELKESEIQ